MKDTIIKMIRSLPVGPTRQEALLFYLKLGYWPDFRHPRTYNEKINHRKLFSNDNRFVICSDKLAVRDFVRERIGESYLVPLLYSGGNISAEKLHSLGDDIVAKTNHDCKSAEIIRKNTAEVAAAAVERLNANLRRDYGEETNQVWYSKIEPKVLVEKMLIEEGMSVPIDYKTFSFKQPDGSFKRVIEVHQNRGYPDYSITSFDEAKRYISKCGDRDYKDLPFPCPEHWDEMLKVSDALAADFDHVRVDLYIVDGDIYFGELTFSDGGGRSVYSRSGGARNDLDWEWGGYWHLELCI
jgi:hypothetical protein